MYIYVCISIYVYNYWAWLRMQRNTRNDARSQGVCNLGGVKIFPKRVKRLS